MCVCVCVCHRYETCDLSLHVLSSLHEVPSQVQHAEASLVELRELPTGKTLDIDATYKASKTINSRPGPGSLELPTGDTRGQRPGIGAVGLGRLVCKTRP